MLLWPEQLGYGREEKTDGPSGRQVPPSSRTILLLGVSRNPLGNEQWEVVEEPGTGVFRKLKPIIGFRLPVG
jgi:hypothetical protein